MRLLTLLFTCVSVSAQGPNPLSDFCRRFGHQTTVIDDRLFIDGGSVVYDDQIDDGSKNVTNSWLVYTDLRSVNDQKFPLQYANLSKPSYVPMVAGGALWADTVNKVFYLYGGEYNSTSLPPTTWALWYFDTIYNKWDRKAVDASANGIAPSSFGAHAVDNERGTAYWYGGWTNSSTVVGHTGDAIMQTGLITYEMDENTWQNQSFIDRTPRAEGAMFYIPAGDAGMLVYFGGIQQTPNGSVEGVPMDTVYVFDIGSRHTYIQATTGGPPGMRRRFCGGVGWPPDRSSYNIYIFGGLPTAQGFGFGDAWILSLPSFTWINYYNESSGQHHSLSCDVVRNGQMILIGGYWPNSSVTECDAKPIWGMHNMDLGAVNDLHEPWYQYLPNVTTYSVPPNVTHVVGGSSLGNATLSGPSGGFSDPLLGDYFPRKALTATRTPTRAIPTSTASGSASLKERNTNIGAIAGGVVGGVLGALSIIGLCLLFWRRRRRRNRMITGGATQGHSIEMPMPSIAQMGDEHLHEAPSKAPQDRAVQELMAHREAQELEVFPPEPFELPTNDGNDRTNVRLG